MKNLKKKWKNLLDERCPIHGCKIFYRKDTQNFECELYEENSFSIFSCDFSISPRRLKELQRLILTGKILENFNHENAESLNNL